MQLIVQTNTFLILTFFLQPNIFLELTLFLLLELTLFLQTFCSEQQISMFYCYFTFLKDLWQIKLDISGQHLSNIHI